MKVSFDFDGTLEREEEQEYVKELIARGIEIWVVTTRYDENQMHLYEPPGSNIDDLWEVVDRLEIPRWRVRFTCMEWKWKYLQDTQFVWHLDDNDEESRKARQAGCKIPIILNYIKDWKQRCEDIINEKTKNSTHQ